VWGLRADVNSYQGYGAYAGHVGLPKTHWLSIETWNFEGNTIDNIYKNGKCREYWLSIPIPNISSHFGKPQYVWIFGYVEMKCHEIKSSTGASSASCFESRQLVTVELSGNCLAQGNT
jgi:hypothetical protein